MIYCKRCLYPDTKPDLSFNEEGICSACLNFEARKNIDWKERERSFIDIIKNIEVSSDQPYHCVIPVSGGKDSHYQIIKALECGANPLAVTAQTDDLSELGRENLDNIIKLGVDHVTVAVNAKLRNKIAKYTLQTIGDISWAEHVTIFSVPVREAILRRIPLIIWGENPQNEYGSPNEESAKALEMRDVWLNEFGGMNGLRVHDLVQQNIASMYELKQYYYPSLSSFSPKAIFMGQFFPWDGKENAEIAEKHGFKRYYVSIECSGVNYENLDNYQTGIHDRFKYLKYGFGRATDIVCNEIRRGRLTRADGIDIVKYYDGYPFSYLGKKLEDILAKIDMTVEEYWKIEDKFINTDLFECKDDDAPGMHREKFEVGKSSQ